MGDELYNTTSDATLEELADRWNAYQALMKKYYKETNFLKRWTRSKWMLCFTTSVLAAYSITALVIAMEYISQKADNAALIMEFHADMVYLCFSGAILGLIMVVVAVIGLIRENRIWLSWHSLFQWPIFFLFVSIGYIAFRRVNNHLRAHLHDEWVYDYSREQRLLVQNDLKCCGYMDSSWYAEYDMRCFPKTVLPGCIFKYNKFEEEFLNKSWQLSFALVPVQIFIMVSTLMTINHVDAMLRSGRPGLKSFKEQ